MDDGSLLHLTVAEHDGATEVVLDGELDLSCVEALSTALRGAIAARPSIVVVDAAHLSYMDSTGIKCLVTAARACDAAGTRLVVRNARGIVLRVMQLTGVDETLLERVQSR